MSEAPLHVSSPASRVIRSPLGWSAEVSPPPNLGVLRDQITPHEALNLTARCKSTFDERAVAHSVGVEANASIRAWLKENLD